MKKVTLLFFVFHVLTCLAFDSVPAGEYSNPVSRLNLPDPSFERTGQMLYLYATEGRDGVPIMRSPNLVDWERVGTAFTPEGRPGFVDGGGIWAPCTYRMDYTKYLLYYSMSTWGGEEEAGIGVAIAESPYGPYTDMGKLVDMANTGVKNSIDPFVIWDNGCFYLFWGSFSGLYGIELQLDGLAVKDGAAPIQVAGSAYEAVYIFHHDDSYYLFASVGTCCEGVNSTYKVVVGRSESLFGPYTDKEGNLMMNNRHEVVIEGNERFKGPGHNSEIITDDEGTHWILYHAVDVEINRGRQLMLDRVDWIDGWPVVGDGTPSLTSQAPVFM